MSFYNAFEKILVVSKLIRLKAIDKKAIINYLVEFMKEIILLLKFADICLMKVPLNSVFLYLMNSFCYY